MTRTALFLAACAIVSTACSSPPSAEARPQPARSEVALTERVEAESHAAPPADSEEQTITIDVAPLRAGPLTFGRLQLARNVIEREPVRPGTRFYVGMRVHLFIEAGNDADTTQTIDVHWQDRAGTWITGKTTLAISAGPRFRTWAKSPELPFPGAYEAVLTAADGTEVRRLPFDVAQL